MCSFLVNKGDRIAQLVLERILTPDVIQVDVRNDLLYYFLIITFN